MKNGKNLFQNIIGYENEKKILERVVDVLNQPEKYKHTGSKIPRGLLLYGPLGIGNTTFSKDILKEVKRKNYVIRKIKSDGSFMDYMSSIFKKAKENQPAIILLDDIDKFAEDDDTKNSEEYVAVQSLIDDIKDEDIFVIATANKISTLPNSLLRAGRFDIKIEIDYPDDKEACDIMKHYLKKKKIDRKVNIKNISYILGKTSCAELEKVCNQAGIYAGFKNKEKIENEEIIRAALEAAYNTNIEECSEDSYALNVAYHEAGHAIVSEYLEHGSVKFITTVRTDSDTKGITQLKNNDYYFDDIKFMENRIISLLGGKAAIEIIYHKCDIGTESDLRRVYSIAERFVDDYCMLDFHSWIRHTSEASEKVKQSKDDNINKLVEKYYIQAKEILLKNKDKLDTLAQQLKLKKILFQDEIEDIYSNPNQYNNL